MHKSSRATGLSLVCLPLVFAGVLRSQTLSPTAVTLSPSQTQLFTVKNPGKNFYTWLVYPYSGVGTINPAGLYTAPASIPAKATATIYASCPNQPTLLATVTLVPKVGITVLPSAITMTNGQTAPFMATVTGTTVTGYTWATPAYGSIDSSGNYTVPKSLTAQQNVILTATSVEDPTRSASAVVTLIPTITVALNPVSTTVFGGQTVALNGAVYGAANTGMNWSMSPQIGTLANGSYTAPGLISSAQTVTITATSQAVASRSASVALSLVPVSISLSPTSASLTNGQKVTLKASVSDALNTGVTWSLSPAIGSIAGGVYTAPPIVTSAQSLTVTATSMADSTKSARATIALAPSLSVSVTPSAASLTGGQSASFDATVIGSGNPSVTWSLSPPVGTLSNGVYTAPTSISAAEVVTVTATSVANSAKTATASISLVPPAPVIKVSLSPSTASLSAGQSVPFASSVTGTTNTAVNWSVSPQIGTISNGIYMAPAQVAAQQSITVTATSAADTSKSASAVVTLIPSVSVAVSPPSASLSAGQAMQFNASLSGTSNPNVTWSISPNVGSISNGLYQAPASISSQQVVAVTATSQADSTKTAHATVTLLPSAGIALTPSSVTLSGGQSAAFIVTINGSPSTAVTWSLNPSVGIITNGTYQAPATVSTSQTIVLTVASSANASQSAQSTITLNPAASSASVTPSTVTLGPSGTQKFSATGLGANPTWTIAPPVGTIDAGGLYTAPSSVSSQTSVLITAANASSSTQSASAMVTLNPASGSSSSSGSGSSGSSGAVGSGSGNSTVITLPLEVIGPNGKTVSASFNLPSGTSVSSLTLWMQIHGLRTEQQASVQLNGGAWQPISSSTVTLLGLAQAYGGIGGGFHTISMTMPAANLTTGSNTITFRFNQTDGRVSGFRVLAFNIQDSEGNSLIPSTVFVNDDPNSWQAPLNDPTDIAAGQTLWRTAALTVPSGSSSTSIQAHCMDCHAQDGRDLKYFNYSNNSIQTRAIFHGLTAQQGEQIASYIRALNVPNPGRPWNPPYQPGPGLDSQPVEQWSAGAGISGVLDADIDTLSFLAPNGDTSLWNLNANMSTREIPIALQLPDWNSWLPAIYPFDAWGAEFTTSPFGQWYPQLRSMLIPGDAAAYLNAAPIFRQFSTGWQFLLQSKIDGSPAWNATFTNQVYSTTQWAAVKMWELNQEFQLEGLSQALKGPGADPRSWYLGFPFQVSPNFLHIPTGSPGLPGNGSAATWTYLAFIWYDLQLILNNTDHNQGGRPIDWEYAYGFIKDLSRATSKPQGSIQYLWLVKGLQVSQFDGGPQQGSSGWHPGINAISLLADPNWNLIWPPYTIAERAQYDAAYLENWITAVKQFTPQQFYQGGWTTSSEVPANRYQLDWADQVFFSVPHYRYVGVPTSIVNQLVSWAETMWPLGNWSSTLSVVCTMDANGSVKCPNDRP